MKIVYEAPLFTAAGGGPRHFEGISTALIELGLELHTVLPRLTDVRVPPGARRSSWLPTPGSRALRHVSYEFARIGLLLWWWVSGRRVDVWMSRHSLFGVGTMLARRVAGTVVLEVNGPVREEVAMNFGSERLAGVVDKLFRLQIKSSDLVVAVSPALRQYVLDRDHTANCYTVPNGAFAAESEGSSSPNSLVYSGALSPWYDLRTVLEAVSLLVGQGLQVAMHVVGDGSERAGLESVARSKGLTDHVHFTGWVSQSEARRYVEAAVVGVIPLNGEAIGRSPLKMYEYAAAGLSIVAPAIDGVANSPLASAVHTYDVGDAEGCAEALLRAIEVGRVAHDSDLWSWSARGSDILGLMQSAAGEAAEGL